MLVSGISRKLFKGQGVWGAPVFNEEKLNLVGKKTMSVK
jgi:hypothetical protein